MQRNSERRIKGEKRAQEQTQAPSQPSPSRSGRFFSYAFTGFLVTWLPCVFLFSIFIKGVYILIAGTAAALIAALVYAKVVNRQFS